MEQVMEDKLWQQAFRCIFGGCAYLIQIIKPVNIQMVLSNVQTLTLNPQWSADSDKHRNEFYQLCCSPLYNPLYMIIPVCIIWSFKTTINAASCKGAVELYQWYMCTYSLALPELRWVKYGETGKFKQRTVVTLSRKKETFRWMPTLRFYCWVVPNRAPLAFHLCFKFSLEQNMERSHPF